MRNPFKRIDEYPEITAREKLAAQLASWVQEDLQANRQQYQSHVEEK